MASTGVRQLRQHVPLIKFPQRHGAAVQSLQDGTAALQIDSIVRQLCFPFISTSDNYAVITLPQHLTSPLPLAVVPISGPALSPHRRGGVHAPDRALENHHHAGTSLYVPPCPLHRSDAFIVFLFFYTRTLSS